MTLVHTKLVVSGKTAAMRGKASTRRTGGNPCGDVLWSGAGNRFWRSLGRDTALFWYWLGEEISGRIQGKPAGVKAAALSPHFLPEIQQNK